MLSPTHMNVTTVFQPALAISVCTHSVHPSPKLPRAQSPLRRPQSPTSFLHGPNQLLPRSQGETARTKATKAPVSPKFIRQTRQPPCKGQGNSQSPLCSHEQKTHPCRDVRKKKQPKLKKIIAGSKSPGSARKLQSGGDGYKLPLLPLPSCFLPAIKVPTSLSPSKDPDHKDIHANQTRSQVQSLI